MDETISRAEHEEFCRRLDAANERQDKRLALLEDSVRQLSTLTSSVKELAVNMANMLKEQEKQGRKLEALEARDGEKWRKAVWYVATAMLGAALGLALSRLGLQ